MTEEKKSGTGWHAWNECRQREEAAYALLRECREAVREAVEDGSWAYGPLLAKLDALAARTGDHR